MRILLRILAAFAILIVLVVAYIALSRLIYRDAACSQPASLGDSAPTLVPHASELASTTDYVRDEQITFMTFPEWYIVYSAREYADLLARGKYPHDFQWAEETAQFWCSYSSVDAYAKAHYATDLWENIALTTIGASFSAENMIGAAYEDTIGRMSAWTADGIPTPEDMFEQKVAADYAKYLDVTPWYKYPFLTRVGDLWRTTPAFGPHMIRKWERRFALTLGYSIKGLYGKLMNFATNDTGVYKPADVSILLLAQTPLPPRVASDTEVKVVKNFGDGTAIISIPRYQEFTALMQRLAEAHAEILDISGAKQILISAFAPVSWKYDLPGEQFFTMPLSSDPKTKRVLAVVPTAQLLETLRMMLIEDVALEHVYDY